MKQKVTDQHFARLPLHDAVLKRVHCERGDNVCLTFTVSLEINPYEPLDEFAALGLTGDKLSVVFEDADFTLRGDGIHASASVTVMGCGTESATSL